MVKIQIDLPKNLDKRINLYKIKNDKKTKAEAIKEILLDAFGEE